MKKTTILFLAFLMLFSANVFAEDYNLYVAGVQINDTNKNDIAAAININGCVTASGTISYDPESNILTLDNASINATAGDGIFNNEEILTIELIGENYITLNDGSGIVSDDADLTITGSGSLTITAYAGIFFEDCNLTILNTTVTATGEYFGIVGLRDDEEDDEEEDNGFLTINNSTVRATGTLWVSIACLNNIVLNACEITQPMNAYFGNAEIEFDGSEIEFVTILDTNGGVVKTEVVIAAFPVTSVNEIAVSKIAVYPNPNNGEFIINLSVIDNAISYQVIDAKGAIVKEAKVNSNEEFVSIQAKAGNYTVKVITDSKVFVEQIIVR